MTHNKAAHSNPVRIDVITLFPEAFEALHYGVVGRAIKRGDLIIQPTNPRDFSQDPHQRVDDRPYGGGPGMVMSYQPLASAIDQIKQSNPQAPVIHLTPQGPPLTQQKAASLSGESGLILLASRYEGIDERLNITHIDEEISIGDYVVSGGELPAMVLIDAMARCLPGVLGNTASLEQDSFQADQMLDHPHYTRPEIIDGHAVPPVLLSGDHRAIAAWRREKSMKKTWQTRPDLLKRCSPINSEQAPTHLGETPLPDSED